MSAQQDALFYETPEEALAAVVAAAGGYKALGARLRPDLPADQAGNWLRDCLNVHKRDKLSPGQIVLLLSEGRRVSCHAAMTLLCRESGYADPTPIDPLDERAQLQRAYVDAVGQLGRIVGRLERLGGVPVAVGAAPSLRPVA